MLSVHVSRESSPLGLPRGASASALCALPEVAVGPFPQGPAWSSSSAVSRPDADACAWARGKPGVSHWPTVSSAVGWSCWADLGTALVLLSAWEGGSVLSPPYRWAHWVEKRRGLPTCKQTSQARSSGCSSGFPHATWSSVSLTTMSWVYQVRRKKCDSECCGLFFLFFFFPSHTRSLITLIAEF